MVSIHKAEPPRLRSIQPGDKRFKNGATVILDDSIVAYHAPEISTLYSQNRNSTQPIASEISQKNKEDREENELEIYYQKRMEAKYSGNHMGTAAGVTDVTTPLFHMEIKRGSRWKNGVGQLLRYNAVEPRSELRLCLFAFPTLTTSLEMKTKIIQTCYGSNIDLYIMNEFGNDELVFKGGSRLF